MPLKIRALLVNKYQLGFCPKGKDFEDSLRIVSDINLLSLKDEKITKKSKRKSMIDFNRMPKRRNQSEENALKHWNYLKNAGDKYVSPFRNTSDFILNGTCDLKYFAQILEYIHSVTNNFSE